MHNDDRPNDEEHAPRTPEEDVFYDYLMRMKPTNGQRFLRFLIEDAGYDALEEFWTKLRHARYLDKLELDEPEKKALARALYEFPRRDLLKRGAGLFVLLASARLARKGMEDIDEATRWGRRMQSDEKLEAAAIFASAGVGLVGAFKLMFADVEPSEATIASIAAGDKGEKRVRDLVSCLDKAFSHIECLMDEAGSRSRL